MRLTPDLILRAYASGLFPMAESATNPEVLWFEPSARGVLPLDGFHISRSLRRSLRRHDWRFSMDTAFSDVLTACADRKETWINPAIAHVFQELHQLGHAHSIEVWRAGQLVGGAYGLALAGAFFAESMFSRATDASKLALAELVTRLCQNGFQLLDTQYLTPHLASLGGVEISRKAYRAALAQALAAPADHARAFAPANPNAANGAFWQPVA